VNTRRVLALASGYLLAVVLLVAGLAKLSAFGTTIAYFTSLKHVPLVAGVAGAVLVPALEISLGMLLLADAADRVVRIALVGLFGVFVLYQIANLFPGSRLTETACPCFGTVFPQADPLAAAFRNAALLAVCGVNGWSTRTSSSTGS
jgi:hypothetical protein